MSHNHGKIDGNQKEIVRDLRAIGASAQSLADIGKGCPDIVVGYRGSNFLFELKIKGEKLTEAEAEFHQKWNGQLSVAYSLEDVLKIIGAI